MKALKTVFQYKEGVVSFALTIGGILICLIAGSLIKDKTLNFAVVIIGGFMSLSGSSEFGKVLIAVRKMLEEEEEGKK